METISEASQAHSGATQRLRVYLRCLGIDDDAALQRLSERVLQIAGQSGSADNLEQAVISEILRCKEAWFRALSDEAANGMASSGPDPLTGWRLRMILRKNPDALLCQPDLELCAAAAAAESRDTRAVPQAHESEMPTQPLEELPAGLQKEFWKPSSRV
jgi:hypothetical protein